MADIKPIETIYNGYRFRSRLEARWAVFFDAAGIAYEYEPEGYTLRDGTRYLPDFYLPNPSKRFVSLWVEVKPLGGDFSTAEQFARDSEKSILLAEGVPDFRPYRRINGGSSSLVREKDGGWHIDSVLVLTGGIEELVWLMLGPDSRTMPDGNQARAVAAVLAARQARFEHGETPSPSDFAVRPNRRGGNAER